MTGPKRIMALRDSWRGTGKAETKPSDRANDLGIVYPSPFALSNGLI